MALAIDRLVDLIFFKKKISVTEAAKELNLSPEKVEELSLILKDNYIISIDHSDQEMILVAKKLTQKEYVSKVESFSRRRKRVSDLIINIEDSISSSKKFRGQLFERLKQLDAEVDKTIRDHNYVCLFPLRRDSGEATKLKRQTYQKAG